MRSILLWWYAACCKRLLSDIDSQNPCGATSMAAKIGYYYLRPPCY
jgi:hypothetical protein